MAEYIKLFIKLMIAGIDGVIVCLLLLWVKFKLWQKKQTKEINLAGRYDMEGE